VTGHGGDVYSAAERGRGIVTVEFDEIVNVTGNPTLTMRVGLDTPVAPYVDGTGTTTLTFRYTVSANENTPDELAYATKDSLSDGGGTIKDGDLNNATLTLPQPGETNSLSANKAIVIDTTAPTILSGSVASDNAYVKVTMSEGVYNAASRAGGLETSDFTLEFKQNGGTATNVTIASVTKSNGSALAGGEVSAYVNLTVTGTPSGAETVEIKPADASSIYDLPGNAMAADQTTNALNLKAGPKVTVAVDKTSSAENNTENVMFTVSLDAAWTETVTVKYNITGTAKITTDYKNNSGNYDIGSDGTITFLASETSKTIKFTVENDNIAEYSELVTCTISNPTEAVLGDDTTKTHTITDSDDDPTISIAVSEDTSAENAAETITWTVSLDNESGKAVSATYAVSGTASLTSDYTDGGGNKTIEAGGSVSFLPGQTSRTIACTVVNDDVAENSETVIVTISDPIAATLGTAAKTLTITDSDTVPEISIDLDIPASAEDSALTATYTVSLSKSSVNTVTVNYAVTGSAVKVTDYADGSGNYDITSDGTVTFDPGQEAKTIKCKVVNDDIPEPEENVIVTLADPNNGTLATTTSKTHTISDSDGPPTVSIGVSKSPTDENDADTITYTVSLDKQSGNTVTVNYAIGGTAELTSDYTNNGGGAYTIASNGTVTFDPGDTSKTIILDVVNDTVAENEETVVVTISGPSNANLGTDSATLSITDTDAQPTVSIDVDSITSAENDKATVTYTVSLSKTSTNTVTVDYKVTGLATAPGDFTDASGEYPITSNGTVSFSPDETAKTIKLKVVDDGTPEDPETVIVTISDPSNAALSDTTVKTHTITDSDGDPTVSISVDPTSSAEANTETATYTIALDAVAGENITVDYTVSGTATLTSDYKDDSGQYSIASNGTVTFTLGEQQKTIKLKVENDNTAEDSETVIVTISNPNNAVLGTAIATHTITDADGDPTVSIAVDKDNSAEDNAETVTYTVSLDAQSGKTVTVDYAVTGTALLTSDYVNDSGDYTIASNGTVSFAPGETSKTVKLKVVNDSVPENSETVIVTISNQSNATLGTATKTHTINDGDDDPSVSIAVDKDNSAENNTETVTYTVSLSAQSGKSVTVDYGIGGDAALTSDYTDASGSYSVASGGTITFDAGQTQKTLKLTVVNDAVPENAETVTISISNPSNATLGTASKTHTITDADTDPTVSIAVDKDSSAENNTETVTYTVSLSAQSGKTVTVNYAVTGDAAAPGDYIDGSGDYLITGNGTVTFSPGDTSKTIKFTVVNDRTQEAPETVTVTLSGENNATLGTAAKTHTITDADGDPTVAIAVLPTNSAENAGSTATYTVSLDIASTLTVTVDYTVSGDAAAPGDYVDGGGNYDITSNGTITFNPGDQNKTLALTVQNDGTAEDNETATVTISNPSEAVLGTAVATHTITDTDADPTVAIAVNPTGSAENTAQEVTYTVSLDAASGKTVTVNYAISGDAALTTDYVNNSGDYSIASGGTITFNPGDTAKTIKCKVVNDNTPENAETATITLSGENNAALGAAVATHTITDTDTGPGIDIGLDTVNAAEDLTSTVTYTVTLDSAFGLAVTVDYAITGTAVLTNDYTDAGGDYSIAGNGTMTFAPGETTKTIKCKVVKDNIAENDETVIVTLSNPTNGAVNTAAQTHTINNDDPDPTVTIAVDDDASAEAETATVTYTVSLSSESGKTVTVDYGVVSTATLNTDYQDGGGEYNISGRATINFAAGETAKTIKIKVNDDPTDEDDETVTITISSPTNAILGTTTNATHTITDDDAPPTASIAVAPAASDENDQDSATYTVTLSAASGKAITIDYAVSGTATLNDDYQDDNGNYDIAGRGTMNFAAGDAAKTIKIKVKDDAVQESDETVIVTISNATNATLGTAAATHTINNDEPVANSAYFYTDVDVAFGGTVTASDPDGLFSFKFYGSTTETNPANFNNEIGNGFDTTAYNGKLTNVNNAGGGVLSFTYTPAAGYRGPDYFYFVVEDTIDNGRSNVATVSIAVGVPPWYPYFTGAALPLPDPGNGKDRGSRADAGWFHVQIWDLPPGTESAKVLVETNVSATGAQSIMEMTPTAYFNAGSEGLVPGTYYWRYRAWNSEADKYGDWQTQPSLTYMGSLIVTYNDSSVRNGSVDVVTPSSRDDARRTMKFTPLLTRGYILKLTGTDNGYEETFEYVYRPDANGFVPLNQAVEFTVALPPGNYKWTAQVHNPKDENEGTTIIDPGKDFTVGAADAPNITGQDIQELLPADGAIIAIPEDKTSVEITLQWKALAGAVSYAVYLGATGAAPIYNYSNVGSDVSRRVAVTAGSYTWCVIALDAAGNWSDYTAPHMFDVIANTAAPLITSVTRVDDNNLTLGFGSGSPAATSVDLYHFENDTQAWTLYTDVNVTGGNQIKVDAASFTVGEYVTIRGKAGGETSAYKVLAIK